MSEPIDQLASRNSDPMARAIKFSLGIHIGLLVLLYLKSVVMPGPLNTKEYIPSLRVDLVALPDQKATEVVTPAMPAVSSEEVKETVKKEKVIKTPVAEKGDYSLNKKKSKKDRMKSALDRIKSLEKIKEGEQIKGNKVMRGSSAKGEATNSVETTYFDVVLDKIRNEWELPQWLKDKNLSAKVLIKIDRRGMITKTQFIKSSGNEQFDSAVRRTLQASSPFAAPPLSILADVSQDGIVFGFPIGE